jgi:hypothetical protein
MKNFKLVRLEIEETDWKTKDRNGNHKKRWFHTSLGAMYFSIIYKKIYSHLKYEMTTLKMVIRKTKR